MPKRTPAPQLAFSFEEPSPEAAPAPVPLPPAGRLQPDVWRWPGDPQGTGKDMTKRCQNTYPELGGLPCLLRTNDIYCDTCAAQRSNR